ncbi:MAG: acylphosphatase [Ruminiclostridium sp.]|nr:acylphosphatase [Ruminiclostridium sp.]
MRKHIIFYGSVQGVGFRYSAFYAARSYGVSGWVRNLSDGSVEMEAEGTERDIDNMILSIEKGQYISIDDISVKNVPVKGSSYFEVR